MELIQDRGTGNYIDSYQDSYIEVNKIRYETSLIIMPQGMVVEWRPNSLAELQRADLDNLVVLTPKILLLGTGKTFEFPSSELLVKLYAAKIGIEVMDTAAACRTYNILMSEGRAVVAALLIG